MATKQFLSLDGLTTYDGLIKQYIATEDAKSIKSITVVGNTVNFFKTADASGTAAYTVNLPDVSGFMEKIANAEGDKVVVSNSDGSVSESEIAIDDIAYWDTSGTTGYILVETAEGGINSTSIYPDDIVTGNIDSEGDEIDYLITSDHTSSGNDVAKSSIATTDLITGYDANGFDSDEHLNEIIVACGNPGDYNKVSISGVKVEDLATNAFVGSIPQGSSATTVVGYVDEVAGSITTASDVTLVEAQTPTTGYLKTYELYQGGNAAANLVGKIDIPKDLVVTSGEIVVNPTGQPAGTYLKLTIANQTTPVYINVADLCDAYTAASSATQVQLAISNTNEISATLVAGGVGTTELASSAVTTAKIADDAVTAAKVNIAAHSETDTGVAIDSNDDTSYNIITVEVETTDGQVSNVDVTVNDLESFVSAKIGYEVPNMIIDSIDALDADVVQSAGADGLALEVIQEDGILRSVTGSIAANTYDSYGAASTVQSTVIGTSGDAASANTINGAKAYADAATAAISTADINALFNS